MSSSFGNGIKLAMYEYKTAELEYGNRRIQMTLEHAVTSLRFRGMTHYGHYYNADVQLQTCASQASIDSPENLPAICMDSEEFMKRKSISEAEAKVAEFPNRSRAWMDGARCYLRYAGLLKAKEFLKRGIETIKSGDFKECQEKLNLWIALMKIESEGGSRDGMLATFEEALKHNNKRDCCLQVLHWMIQYKDDEDWKLIKEAILKKFGRNKEVYLILFEYYLKQGAINEGRTLLQKCLKRVPSKEHPDILDTFADLEEKYGGEKYRKYGG